MYDDDGSLKLGRIQSRLVLLKRVVVDQGEVVVLPGRIVDTEVGQLGTRC